jgi:hypothetical protein
VKRLRAVTAQIAVSRRGERFRYFAEALLEHGAPEVPAPVVVALQVPVAPAHIRLTELSMETHQTRLSCHSCSKAAESLPGEPPCEVLKDQATVVPEVFLNSFGESSGDKE